MPDSTASAADATDAAPLDRALAALRTLGALRPVGELRHADIARESGLPWQTVRSLLGPRERFADWLERPDDAAASGGTRTRILDAAGRCFARKGFASASLDEVAAEAGLTKGAVYWHFAGKDDLFFALLDARCAEMDRAMPAIVAAATSAGQAARDPKRALTTLIAGIVRHLGDDPNWPRLFIEFFGQTRDPAVRSRFGQRYLESYADVAAMVRAGIPTGSVPRGDADDLAVFWIALIDGLMLAWLVNPDRIDPAARIARLIDILWDGLGAGRNRAPDVEPS